MMSSTEQKRLCHVTPLGMGFVVDSSKSFWMVVDLQAAAILSMTKQ